MNIPDPKHLNPASLPPTETGRSQKPSPSVDSLQKHPPQTSADSVNLSIPLTELHQIREAVDQLPDVRQDRIEQLRAAIESGHYQVDSKDVADRIIQDTIS